MRVKLTKGSTARDCDLAALQQRIGGPLSSEFLKFVAENDGAEPETNIFGVASTNESGVNRFIPVRNIVDEMRCIENLPSSSFLIAWAEGGNYVFMNQADDGAVFFWDHEQPEFPVKLANSFQAFLELLTPFDVSSVQLKPGQVTKVWIDPDFLKEIQG